MTTLREIYYYICNKIHFTINISKLIKAIPEVASIGSGISCENLVLIICGALGLWLTVKDIATVNISKEQAFVIVALWKNCSSSHKILIDDGFIATNKLLEQYGESKMANLKYNMIIDSLVEMQCIEITEGTIWLREYISPKIHIQRIGATCL